MFYIPMNYDSLNQIAGHYSPSMVKAYNNATYAYWERSLFQRACSRLKTTLPDNWGALTDEQKAELYPTIPLVEDMLADSKTDITAITDDLYETIDDLDAAKQDKASAAYQIGTSDGAWVSLVATLPAECKTGTSVCSLVAAGGKLSWEVIAGQAADDVTIKDSVIPEKSAQAAAE